MADATEITIGKDNCPLLTASNWHAWRPKFKALCRRHLCWEAIDGWDDEQLDYGAEQRRRKRLDDKAYGLLIGHVDDAYIDLVESCEEAKEAYDKLKTECTNYTVLHIVQFLDDLVSVKKTDDMKMQEYIATINSHAKKLKSCDTVNITDSILGGLYLRGLRHDKKYEAFIRSLEVDAKFESEAIRSKLVLEEMRIKSMEAEEEEQAVALKAQAKFKPKKKTYQNNQQHTSNMPQPKSNNYSQPKYESSGGQPHKFQRKYKCFCCGEMGHKAMDCPSAATEEEENKPKQTERPKAKVANREYKALCASRIKTVTDQGTWILDGGATDHMTPRKDLLRDFVPLNGEVSVGDGSLVSIAGKGKMLLHISQECGGYDLDFSEVFYVPQLSDNLLSQAVLDNHGMKLVTYQGKTEVFDGEALFMVAHKVGKLYFVSTSTGESIHDISNRYETAKKNASLVTLDTWHRRLGHPHREALLKIPPIAENCKKKSGKEDCDACIVGKMRCVNYPKERESTTESVLERVHSDVVGPISPESMGGSRYFVTFIDDYSNYVVTFSMKKKSEVFRHFLKYQSRCELIHKKKMEEFQSDYGGEYTSLVYAEHLQKCGILHRYSSPGVSQQNGKAERHNLSLLNSLRSMLYMAGVPLKFWAEGLHTTTYLRNFCPSKSIKNKIPFEVWSGKEVTLKMLKRLKVFGCQAWAATDCKKKLDARAEECVMIGYPEGVKGYKLYALKRQKIIISRDVHFNEKKFPFLDRNRVVGTPARQDLLVLEPEEEDDEESNHEDDEEDDEESQGSGEVDTDEDLDPYEDAHSGYGSGPESEEEVQDHQDEDLLHVDGVVLPPVVPQVDPPVACAVGQNPPCHIGGNPQPVRASGRIRKEKEQCTLDCCKICKRHDEVVAPKNYNEAMKSPQAKEWIAAMQEEYNTLCEMKTWTIVKRMDHMNVVGCRWVYALKKNHAGEIVKYKARLVAQGYGQIAGLDFAETYSPVMRRRCLRILIAIAVENQWEIHQIDVISAYLNSPLDFPVFMEQPIHFSENDPHVYVCHLLKSLYGLKQSGRNWNNYLHQCLMDIGLNQSNNDMCIYYQSGIIIGVHVDDMLVVGEAVAVQRFKFLIQRQMKIKDLGEANLILSVRVQREEGGVTIDQSSYVQEILAELDQLECFEHPAPLPNQAINRILPNEDNVFDNHIYRKAIGCLQYLAGGTRPDIAFSTTRLSQYCEKPTTNDWDHCVHLLGYLKKTKDYKIHYSRSGHPIEVFVDADWASDPGDAVSVTGYVIKLAGGAISYISKKQTLPKTGEPLIAVSTIHSEYYALYAAAVEAEWLKELLTEIGQGKFVASPVCVWADNIGAIQLAHKEGHSERSRNIKVKFHYTRQLIKCGVIEVTHIKSEQNLADLFTKILSGTRVKRLAKEIGVY